MSDCSDSEGSSSEAATSDAEIVYDFNQMQKDHMNEVAALLDRFLPGEANPDTVWALTESLQTSEFTTVLIPGDDEKGSTGSKSEDSPTEVHGVIGALVLSPLETNLKHPIIEFLEFYDTNHQLKRIVSEHSTLLIVLERVVDIPQIAAQTFVNLTEELEASWTKSSCSADYLLVFARVSLEQERLRGGDTQGGSNAESDGSKKSKRAKTGAASGPIDPSTLVETDFVYVEHFHCWQHRLRDETLPFIAIFHPCNVRRSPEGEVISTAKEYSIPILVPRENLPLVVASVKELDAFFDA
eukprot:NODE_3726_length_928_cov_10.111490_g3426_i0.p1 GENE.NODE_3726_length_928_cov_10.111490_g3426_i0~~NODE_3726_length_928_cov_10.111490_g3426_i0.p1  ORF type:complete len:298 (-),score=71.64 NODE_3726_length_928_cov_10.111490_g3426_i0:35-928(-)